MKADMDRKTARRYVTAAKLPSEMKQPRTWRTRPDPFAEDWPAVTDLLATTPGLQALDGTRVADPQAARRYNETHLRTLQRRIDGGAQSTGPLARCGSRRRTAPARRRKRTLRRRRSWG